MKKVIALLFAMLMVFALVGCGDEPVEEPDANGWVKDDYVKFITVTQNIADDYIAGYKTSSILDDWKFTKFSSDVIFVQTDIEIKDTSEKQELICTFSWKPESEEYLGHYLSIGGNVFLDDGTATPKM